MPNPRLTSDQLEIARALLEDVRGRLAALSAGDRELLFAYRRKVYKELMHDERSKPMVRRRLKLLKMKEQDGRCPICNELLPDRGAVLDRTRAVDGYVAENTRLIHASCDVALQAAKGYA
jgi:methionine salvage enolase-phosphatase E1